MPRLRFLLPLFAVSLAAGASTARHVMPAESQDLVVHEWGTFTSMQGSDGVGLEGLQHEEEALPPFVYSRTEVRECPLRQFGYKGLEMPLTGVTQKMETPVIYFHTDLPQRVRVRVDFIDGLLTQWFPVSDKLGPPEPPSADDRLDLTQVARSFLQWDIELLPDAQTPVEVPWVPEEEPWDLARQVDAAWVRTLERPPGRMGPVEAERYLFYRGLGTFELPLTLRTGKRGSAVLSHDGLDELPYALALEVRGDLARWAPLGEVLGGTERALGLDREVLRPFDDVVAELKQDLHGALVDQGLFADEATAMIRTWSRSWFATEGMRLLYVVPSSLVEQVLPLTITPEPDETVRVLVGRLEVMTPEVEASVERALWDLEQGDETERAAAVATLRALDRFLEPHLRRTLTRSSSPIVRSAAQRWLDELSR